MYSCKRIIYFSCFLICSSAFGDSSPDYSRIKTLAEDGNIQAQVMLGVMYAEGKGVSQDYSNAVIWFLNATASGDADAQYSLGVLYFSDIEPGIQQDLELSRLWFLKAAKQAHADAQNYLGIIYLNGFGIEKDEANALKWFKLAAENGNANSQNNMGWFYSQGKEANIDLKKALKWYLRAAIQEEPNSLIWIQQNAEQGNSDAQFNIGWLYDIGLGVPKNDIIRDFPYEHS